MGSSRDRRFCSVADAKQRFDERYGEGQNEATVALERDVIGGDYGANSYTTRKQVDVLLERLELRRNQRLLDVGAGRGWPGLYLAKRSGCESSSQTYQLRAFGRPAYALAKTGSIEGATAWSRAAATCRFRRGRSMRLSILTSSAEYGRSSPCREPAIEYSSRVGGSPTTRSISRLILVPLTIAGRHSTGRRPGLHVGSPQKCSRQQASLMSWRPM